MAIESTPEGYTYPTTDAEAGTAEISRANAYNSDAKLKYFKSLTGQAQADAATALGTLGAVRDLAKQADQSAASSALSSLSSAAASNAAADTVERFGDDVELLKQMAEITPGSVTDAQTALLIQDPESETHTRLNAQTVQFMDDSLGVEVAWTSDFTAAQGALDRAKAKGKRAWLAGTLNTDQTLMVHSDVDLGGLTINYSGSGIAVQVGTRTASLMRAEGTLPRVRDASNTGAGQWTDTVGIQLINNDSCVWLIPHVKNFGVGVDEVGDNRGHAYNEITFLHLDNNRVNNRLRGVGTGWANQNLHQAGRFGHNSGEGAKAPGSRHIQIVQSSNLVNNNSWVGPSLEATIAEYHAEIGGVSNMILNGRWEASGGARVLWNGSATRNQILFGYGSHQIVETFDPSAGGSNIIMASSFTRLTASGNYPLHVLENGSSDAAPVEVIMGAGEIRAGSDVNTRYSVRRTAAATHMKGKADAFDRIRIDHGTGRIHFGTGAAAPSQYFGAVGSRLGVNGVTTSAATPAAGGAGALPPTPKGYFEWVVNGVVGLIPYY